MRNAVVWSVLAIIPTILLSSCSVAEFSSDARKSSCGVSAPELGDRQATPQRSATDVGVRVDGVSILGILDVKDARDAESGDEYLVAFDESEDAFSDDYVAPDVESVDENCRLTATHVRSGDNPVVDFEQTVGVLDREGFSAIADTAQEGGPWQSLGEGWSGDDFLWLETSSTNLDWEDWRLMRSKGGVADPEISSSSLDYFATETPPAVSGGYTTISVNDLQVAWNTSDPVTGQPLVLVQDDGAISEHGDGAWLHSADDEAIFYVQGSGDHRAEGGGEFTIIRIPGNGADEEEVLGVTLPPDRETISQLAVYGDTLAFTVPARLEADGFSKSDAQIYVVDLAAGTAIVIQTAGDGADTASLDVSDGFVAFGNGSSNGDSGQYVLALDAMVLLRLGDAEGRSYIGADGDVVAWTTELPSDRLGVRVAKFAS